jgi:hypothetical protein
VNRPDDDGVTISIHNAACDPDPGWPQELRLTDAAQASNVNAELRKNMLKAIAPTPSLQRSRASGFALDSRPAERRAPWAVRRTTKATACNERSSTNSALQRTATCASGAAASTAVDGLRR